MIASDIEPRLSGGAANADTNASLGGAMSSTAVVNNTLQNLFDNVNPAERVAGSVEYRCYYYTNKHVTEALEDAVVYIGSLSSGVGTAVAIGLDPAGIDGEATTIPDEITAPSGVAFSAPETAGAGLVVGDVAPGEYFAVWVRRTIDAGAPPAANSPFTIRVNGTPA